MRTNRIKQRASVKSQSFSTPQTNLTLPESSRVDSSRVVKPPNLISAHAAYNQKRRHFNKFKPLKFHCSNNLRAHQTTPALGVATPSLPPHTLRQRCLTVVRYTRLATDANTAKHPHTHTYTTTHTHLQLATSCLLAL